MNGRDSGSIPGCGWFNFGAKYSEAQAVRPIPSPTSCLSIVGYNNGLSSPSSEYNFGGPFLPVLVLKSTTSGANATIQLASIFGSVLLL